MAETTKRLLAQLANERLVAFHLLPPPSQSPQTWSCILTANGNNTTRQAQVDLNFFTTPLSCHHWRPNDFQVPVLLSGVDHAVKENDPGAVFEFFAPGFACDEPTTEAIARELRNGAAMSRKWLEIAATKPVLDLNSSFLEWEASLILGHPTHPFHRTCVADKLLEPVGPEDLPDMLNPGISLAALPRSSVYMYGPFEKLTHSLLKCLGVAPPASDDLVIVPCLSRQLPALLHYFPEAEHVRSVPSAAKAHAAIRTVSVPGYEFDIKFSLACQITSALRVLPCWSAAAAPQMTAFLRKILPEDLWLFGEVAAVTGSQEVKSEARHLTCILRENLEAKAEEHDEALVLVSALMEKPLGGQQTYAEILFDLSTTAEIKIWFTSYIKCLFRLGLDPLLRHGVGFELHAQNTVARICRKSKKIKGFAVRDLAGVRLHGPTLKQQGFDVDIAELITDDLHQIWNRVHHALLQNNVGYMLYALGLEGAGDGWAIVRSTLSEVLESDKYPIGREMCRYFTKETMPFKSFLKMRMGASFESSMAIVENEIPSVLAKKSPWLLQISLAGTQDPKHPVLPEEVHPEIRIREREALQARLADSVRPYGALPRAARRLNPHPALLPWQFVKDLEIFNEALAIALNNIIGRWWTDQEANLPSRMPLEPRVEELLQWVDKATASGIMPPFQGNQGNLRPDILLPATTESETLEFCVCEINGRFPISFLHYVATAYEALAGSTWNTPLIEPATKHNALLEALFELFNSDGPIHFLQQSHDFPSDSPLFGLIEERTGWRPRTVSPGDLRLVPSTTSPTGFTLCCVWGADPTVKTPPGSLLEVHGEMVEPVHQVGLQLYDFELFSLSPETVRHIAMCCRNDLRSVFIAHDKRILGIILQELDNLVDTQRVLSPAQAQTLREHIVPTILPGTTDFRDLIRRTHTSPEIKDKYILKPVRDARGVGILLGRNISIERWQSILNSLDNQVFHSSATQYMLQPLLNLRSFEWFWDEERQIRKSRSVGTYYSVNGRFVGFGMWRTGLVSEDVISASTKDATSVLAVVALP
ncbi:IucC family-domain-containing protein [Aspergillus falconensis]